MISSFTSICCWCLYIYDWSAVIPDEHAVSNFDKVTIAFTLSHLNWDPLYMPIQPPNLEDSYFSHAIAIASWFFKITSVYSQFTRSYAVSIYLHRSKHDRDPSCLGILIVFYIIILPLNMISPIDGTIWRYLDPTTLISLFFILTNHMAILIIIYTHTHQQIL